jgi:hypothetical protein
MIEEKIHIVDDFMNEVRSHVAAVQTNPMWAQRVGDLEVVLRALFVSDDARAIEMSDEVRRVIRRKRVTLKKRLLMVENILREGGVNVFADTPRSAAGPR